jgi:hypothetical protein
MRNSNKIRRACKDFLNRGRTLLFFLSRTPRSIHQSHLPSLLLRLLLPPLTTQQFHSAGVVVVVVVSAVVFIDSVKEEKANGFFFSVPSNEFRLEPVSALHQISICST